jgi:hypothetical protein
MGKKDINNDIMDLLDGRRKFDFENAEGEKTEYYIGTPTANDIKNADWEHAKRYNQALKEGIFTTSEMMEILKKRNIIGREYDKKGEELRLSLAEKVIEMERETDKEERMRLAIEVANLREEVFQWNQRLSSPLASTCENIANDARVEFITSSVIQDKEGNKLWDTFDDYRSESNLTLQTKARFEVMLWLEGVESDFLEKAPENMVIKELLNAEELEASAPVAELSEKVQEAEEAEEAEVESSTKKRVYKKRVKKSG